MGKKIDPLAASSKEKKYDCGISIVFALPKQMIT